MKRKIIVVLFVFMMLAATMLVVAACTPEHDHQWEFAKGWFTDHEPTCTEDGYGVIRCSICSEIKQSRGVIPALGHDYQTNEQTEPTCTSEGYLSQICSRCGDVQQTYPEALGHDWDILNTVPPDCVTDGVNMLHCLRCDEYGSESIPALGHKTVPIGNRIEPNCTESGMSEGARCIVCGVTVSKQTEIPPLGHTYSKQDGLCIRCGVEGEFTVTFMANGQLVGRRKYTPSNMSITEPSVPAKMGYSNARWESYELNFEDITVNAVYDLIEYAIHYQNVDGAENPNPTTYNIESQFQFQNAAKTGYDFGGWTSNGKPITDIKKGTTGELTLSAAWTVKQCTVTYHSNGGNTIAPKTVPYGTHFEPTKPTHPLDYDFLGWFDEEGQQAYDSDTVITNDLDVYAQWLETQAISTKEQLLAIRDNPDKNYHLTGNINMMGQVWQPIDNFSGVLDGRGYKIMNFSVADNTAGNNYAMFLVNDGTIYNIELADIIYNVSAENTSATNFGVLVVQNNGTISGCTVSAGTLQYTVTLTNTAQDFCFGVITAVNKGTVRDCSVTVDLSCNIHGATDCIGNNTTCFYTGGVVGRNEGTVTGCHYDGTMTVATDPKGNIVATGYGVWNRYWQTDRNYFGGVIGVQSGGSVTKSYSNFNYNHQKSTLWTAGGERIGWDNSFVGGLVGLNTDRSQISYCYANGVLNDRSMDGSTVGGLVAVNENNSTVSSCYSTADIVSNASVSNSSATVTSAGTVAAGGLVGENGATVQDSYAAGNISGADNSTVGGFVGKNTSTGSISKCYSTGNVSASSGTADFFAGSSSGTMYKCYYLEGATAQSNGTYRESAANGTPKPYSVLWTTEFLVGELYWDDSGWIILINENPILDWEVTISHDYERTVVAPTCTDFGYTVYTCRDCDRIFVRDYIAPLEHHYDYDHPQIVPPTCTDDGHTYYKCTNEGCEYLHEDGEPKPALGHTQSSFVSQSEAKCEKAGETVYHCDVCNSNFTVETPALQHQPEIKPGDERVEPTCKYEGEQYVTTSGRTAKVTCSVCGKTLEESREIEPHTFAIDDAQSVKPDCTTAGKNHLTCTTCGYSTDVDVPEKGHTVTKGTARCAVCGQYVVNEDTITKISNLDGLKAIANNLSGIYMLTADIDLLNEKWTPIGTESAPFTGMLFGNGFKIKNLTLSNLANCGLFGCNAGEIVGLTLENSTLSAADVDNALLGVIAAVNKGKLVECTVSGAVEFRVSVMRTTGTFEGSTVSYYATMGGLAAENAATGTVSNCTVSANIKVSLLNEFKNVAPVDLSFYLLRSWKQELSVFTASFTFGGAVGRNSGTVEQCIVSGNVNVNITQNIYIERTTNKGILGKVKYKAGKMEIIANIYAGALVGYNGGTVADSKARGYTLSVLGGTQDDSSNFFSMKHTLNCHRNTDAAIADLVGYSQENAHCDKLEMLP